MTIHQIDMYEVSVCRKLLLLLDMTKLNLFSVTYSERWNWEFTHLCLYNHVANLLKLDQPCEDKSVQS